MFGQPLKTISCGTRISRMPRARGRSIEQIMPGGVRVRHLAFVSVSLIAMAASLHAQQAPNGTPPATQAAPPEAAAASEPPEAMEDPQIGDHWTYELRDEVSGDVKSTFIQTVTDVTAT